MKRARGQNNLFQNASLLMCFCGFPTGQFYTLKTQSVRHAIELLFKVQISPVHPTSNTSVFHVQALSCELCSTFNGNSDYKLFPIFLSNRREFSSVYLDTYSWQRSKLFTDKVNSLSFKKGL